MQEFNHSRVLELVCPSVRWDVYHSTEQLQEKISVLVSLMSELDIAVHISFKRIQRVGIELRDIAANFEKQGVAVLESPLDQLLVLVVLSHDLSITRVSRQVDGQGDKLFSDDWLWAVDNELVDNGDALCVRECCLKLIFLGHVVEELEDESAETRRF